MLRVRSALLAALALATVASCGGGGGGSSPPASPPGSPPPSPPPGASAPLSVLSTGSLSYLFGVQGNLILYEEQSLGAGGNTITVKVRNVTTGADVVLANADFRTIASEAPNYAITPQYVFGPFKNYTTGCPGPTTCIGRWSVADGSFTLITNTDPLALRDGAVNYVVSEDRFALWRAGSNRPGLNLYDPQTGNTATIVPPNGNGIINDVDVVVVSGAPVVYYWASNSFFPPRTCTLYRWSAANGSEVVDTTVAVGLSFTDIHQFEPFVEADNDWVAYTRVVPGAGTNQQAQIVKRPTTGGAAITMANDSRDFILRDGVLLWWEMPASSASLMAWSAARGVTSLGAYPVAGFTGKAVGSGYAVYSLDFAAELTTWNSATGTVLPRGALKGNPIYVTGGYAYFRFDLQVYRMAL